MTDRKHRQMIAALTAAVNLILLLAAFGLLTVLVFS